MLQSKLDNIKCYYLTQTGLHLTFLHYLINVSANVNKFLTQYKTSLFLTVSHNKVFYLKILY